MLIAIGAAAHGVGYFAEADTAPAGHFDLLFEAQEFTDNFTIEGQCFRAVGPQNIRDRAALA